MEWFLGLFKWERPIARLEYFLSCLGFSAILMVLAAIVGVVTAALNLDMSVAYILFIPIGLVAMYVGYLLVVKRVWDLVGDLKTSFFWALGIFVISIIPIVNFISFIPGLMLLFCPSGQFKKGE